MYVVVLPAPTVYYFFKDSSGDDAEDSGVASGGSFENPLQDNMDTVDDGAGLAPSKNVMKGQSRAVSTVRLSKLQREAKVQRAEIDWLKAENKRLNGGFVSDGKGSSVASAEMAAAEAKAQADVDLQRWDARRPGQVLAIQGLVQEGMLTEESITKAKKTLGEHFARSMSKMQHNAFETEAKLQMATRSAQMDRMRQQTPAAFAAHSSLSDWLDLNRLTRHEHEIIAMAGPETALDDLMLLDEEDVAELCSAMTKVEARRFTAALKANADKPAFDDSIAEGSSENLSSSSKSMLTSSQL